MHGAEEAGFNERKVTSNFQGIELHEGGWTAHDDGLGDDGLGGGVSADDTRTLQTAYKTMRNKKEGCIWQKPSTPSRL